VRVDDDELAELDAMRNGVSRAAFVRSLVRKPPEEKDVASYEEALAILTAMPATARLRRRLPFNGLSTMPRRRPSRMSWTNS
jgi:hypothetical protein